MDLYAKSKPRFSSFSRDDRIPISESVKELFGGEIVFGIVFIQNARGANFMEPRRLYLEFAEYCVSKLISRYYQAICLLLFKHSTVSEQG